MRTIIVIEPERIDGKLHGITCQVKPEPGEYVELVQELGALPFKIGNAVNVRPDGNWPGHFLYDVVVTASRRP